jgi:UDP-glucose 4-epimerase
MAYLVTGGAGFIGSNLVDELLMQKKEVLVIDDFSSGKQENLAQHKADNKLKIFKRSVCDNLEDIASEYQIDAVFHLAALPRVQFSIKEPIKTHNVNVNGTLNLLNLCKNHNVKRFVFSSSSSIYGDQDKMPLNEKMQPNPMSPYALHKLIGENYCKMFNFLYGIETVSLRYFNVYGPRQDASGEYSCLIPKFIQHASKGKQPVINGDGRQTRDFIYISNVVSANICAATTQNKECLGSAFNIGSGRNISVNEVTDEIIKLSKRGIKPIYGPSVIEPKNSLADISKAKNLLGFSLDENSFEKGIKKTYEFFVR